MTKNIFNAAMALVGTAGLLTGCNFDQPEAPCFVQDHPSWAVRYDPVDDPVDASGAGCELRAPVAELMGVFKFSDPDDLSNSLLTLRPQGVAAIASRDPGPTTDQTALGRFDIEPDADDFCTAETLSIASVNAAATSTAPLTTISYEFSNVQVYAAPSTPGTQLRGQVKYTRNGCTSNYAIRAMWPAVACNPTNPNSCAENPNLNPDFATECLTVSTNPTTGAVTAYCVPSKPVPSFR
ncbi:hypothetical protein MFUL124B02_08130 [Myxococcus fulvus 124B02]|nr:hypothetical protein MFUL124B02_08130 [Myxococcus fulvus 124B02]